MSVNYNVLGLIFASMHDYTIAEMTKQRTMGSIPYGGRYRLIDFPLSNMVNSGIPEVGVILVQDVSGILQERRADFIFSLRTARQAVSIRADLTLSATYGAL